MLLWQLEVEILTKVRLGGGHFEIWLPTVVKSNLFSFNVKNIIFRNISKNVVAYQRICSQSINLFQFYYNISDNLFKYANYLIKYARYKNVPSRNGFYTKNCPKISWEKFGSEHYQIVIAFVLSITTTLSSLLSLHYSESWTQTQLLRKFRINEPNTRKMFSPVFTIISLLQCPSNLKDIPKDFRHDQSKFLS